MRKLILAAAAALFASGRRAGAHSAQAPRRHLGRPILGQPVRRISPAIHRRAGAARERARCSATAIKATPRPRPAPAIRPSSPATIRRGPGSSPTSGSTRRCSAPTRASIARRTRRAPGTIVGRLQGLAQASARADPRRADEGALARQPQRRRCRQGPRGGDDERAQGRPALVLDRQAVCDRPCAARGSAGRAEGERRDRCGAGQPRAGRWSRRHSAGEGARDPGRGWRQAGRRRPVRARCGGRGGVPRFARTRWRYAGARGGAGRRDAARPRAPIPDLLAVGLSATDYVGHTYGTEGEEMCLQLLELDRDIGDFLAVLDSEALNMRSC